MSKDSKLQSNFKANLGYVSPILEQKGEMNGVGGLEKESEFGVQMSV